MASNVKREFKHPILKNSSVLDDELHFVDQQQILDACDLSDQYHKIIWNGIPIVVRDILDRDDITKFIDSILSICVDPASNSIAVEDVDFAFRCAVIVSYSTATIPDDPDLRYRFVYRSGLYEIVAKEINQGQLKMLKETVKIYITK